jgi:Cys-tRNA(Pro)/Cys-tRNA(Cys) deacylase
MKTNAVRLLDERQIRYELRSYKVDPDDLSAETVAEKIGLPVEQVFKTLVVKGERGSIYFAVVPGHNEVNLKSLARLAGERKMELAPLKEVQSLTGYIRGGVTALAGKKDYPVFLDESATKFDTISISAGIRGMQVLLNPGDYLQITHAQLGEIAKPK